ncbi:EI24 domain-containing protein [Candidatus Sumerlaeota bacterium]|nr:EI24 domain-containing protein [Candidatus Sumerlaeota bacterium]
MSQMARRPSTSAFSDFLLGLGDPLRGISFLVRHPSLWVWGVLPFLISAVLYIGAIYGCWRFAHGWLHDEFYVEGTAWKALGVLIEILFWIIILIFAALAFIPAATLVANPFNDLLSEKTERIYRGAEVDQPFSLGRLFRALHVGLAGEIRRFVKVTVLLCLALLLNLIPVAGQALASAASAFITISYLSLEYTSFSMDRRLFTWEQKKYFLRTHKARTLGFGAMAFFILTIPGVNALFIPISAVAGTLLFCDTALPEEGSAAR